MKKTVIPEIPPELEVARILGRPDGFYWQDLETAAVHGPFPTHVEAVSDMKCSTETQIDANEMLRQAEEEIGIADWIDPETGEPAEEQAPHIDDEEH